jgi:hypothetical protein
MPAGQAQIFAVFIISMPVLFNNVQIMYCLLPSTTDQQA